MSEVTTQSDWERFKHELAAMRKSWGCILASGITEIVLRMIALALPLLMTLATVLYFGFLLLVGGIVDIGSAVWVRKWSGFVLHLLVGILYLCVALFFIAHPERAA